MVLFLAHVLEITVSGFWAILVPSGVARTFELLDSFVFCHTQRNGSTQ